MKIRKATLKDLKAIKQLNIELFKDNKKYDKELDIDWAKKHPSYYKKIIIEKKNITLVAEEENKIVGYITGFISKIDDDTKLKRVAEADNMFILKEFRGKGIGSKLFKEFINRVKNKKLKVVRLSAYSSNLRAIKLYHELGFKDYFVSMEKRI